MISFNLPPNESRFFSDFHKNISGITQLQGGGAYTLENEKLLIKILGRKVLLLDSCTSALELGIRNLDLLPGSEIIMPSYTFSSCANACILNGMTPIFVDVEIDTLNIDIQAIEEAITSKTKAIMTIHYAGIAGNLHEIEKICEKYNLVLIEDNAHGFGGTYGGKSLGTFGAFSALSFHSTKNFYSGEGGAICIPEHSSSLEMEMFREKGTDRSLFLRGEIDKYTWRTAGSSMLMTEISALLLNTQLKIFEDLQFSRVEKWHTYHKELKKWANYNGVRQPKLTENHGISGHIYWLIFPSQYSLENFMAHMNRNGIQVTSHYQALHSSIAGVRYGKSAGKFVNTDLASNNLIRLPINADLKPELQRYIIEKTLEFVCE